MNLPLTVYGTACCRTSSRDNYLAKILRRTPGRKMTSRMLDSNADAGREANGLTQRCLIERRRVTCLRLFDRIELGCVGGQSRDHDLAVGGVDVIAHDAAAVRLGTVPQNEQWPAQMALECFEEFPQNSRKAFCGYFF